MTLLILGLILWWAAHLFKRAAPGPRSALQDRMGDASKGVFAVAILASVVLMVIGYRSADFINIWFPPAWTVHLNNLLMLVSVILFGMSASKGRSRAWLRHPMLSGFAVWAVAHLLVNGDLASVLLFGGLGLWSLVAMAMINAAEGPWQRPEPGPVSGDVRLLLISLVVFGVIAGIHSLLIWPFPGGAA